MRGRDIFILQTLFPRGNSDGMEAYAHGERTYYEYSNGFIGIGAGFREDRMTDYDGSCDCRACDGARRPDADYWTNP